jgi:hypothetical protein
LRGALLWPQQLIQLTKAYASGDARGFPIRLVANCCTNLVVNQLGLRDYLAEVGANRGKKVAAAPRNTVTTSPGGMSAFGSSGNPSISRLFCSA